MGPVRTLFSPRKACTLSLWGVSWFALPRFFNLAGKLPTLLLVLLSDGFVEVHTDVLLGAVTHLMRQVQAPCQPQRVGIIGWFCEGDRSAPSAS